MDIVIVTRHPSLVAYLREQGVAPGDGQVLTHATADDIRGRHVIGVLPLHLAALAAQVTVVPLRLTAEHRGRELTLDDVRALADPPQSYVVKAL